MTRQKKYLLLLGATILTFISFFSDTNALNLETGTIDNKIKLLSKIDKNGNERTFSGFTFSGSNPNASLSIQFTKNGVNKIGSFLYAGATNSLCAYSGTFTNSPCYISNFSTNFTDKYFLSNKYGLANEYLIFIASANFSILNRNHIFVIDTLNDTINELKGYRLNSDLSISGVSGLNWKWGPNNQFSYASSNNSTWGGEFLYKNFLISYVSGNLYYYTFDGTGQATLLQTLTAPAGMIAPMPTFGPFEGAEVNVSGANKTVFPYVNTSGYPILFNNDDYSLTTNNADLLYRYPLYPTFFLGNDTNLVNQFFSNGPTLSKGTTLFKQISGSIYYTSTINGQDYTNQIGSGVGYFRNQVYSSGSKIYFSSNAGTNIYSYDVACVTPGFDTCKIDFGDGKYYCSNGTTFSPNKELCSDPNIIIGDTNPVGISSSPGGDGSIKQQAKPTNYNKTLDENGDEYTGTFGENCLYAKLDDKDYQPQQYCRLNLYYTDLNEKYNLELYDKIFCQYNKGYYLYFYGSYNKALKTPRIKRAICSQINDVSGIGSVNNFFQFKDYGFGYLVNGVRTDVYSMTNIFNSNEYSNSDTGAINDFFSNTNFSGSGVTFGSGTLSNWALAKVKQTNKGFSTSKSFRYLQNDEFYNSCTSTGCGLDQFLTSIQYHATIYLGGPTPTQTNFNGNGFENIDGTESQGVFDCDSDQNGEVSYTEGFGCIFTVLGNAWRKTQSYIDNTTIFMKSIMNIGNVETKPFFGFNFIEKAHADSGNALLDTVVGNITQGQTNEGFFGILQKRLKYLVFGMLFTLIVTLFLVYKK